MPQEAKYRICIINKNIPDMISSVAAKLSAEGINIENMVSKGRGDYAYTILETNDEISLELLERMRQREGIVRVRIIVQEINIENMVSKGRGDYAYTILETNDEISLELLERMRQREGIVRVRIIVQDHV